MRISNQESEFNLNRLRRSQCNHRATSCGGQLEPRMLRRAHRIQAIYVRLQSVNLMRYTVPSHMRTGSSALLGLAIVLGFAENAYPQITGSVGEAHLCDYPGAELGAVGCQAGCNSGFSFRRKCASGWARRATKFGVRPSAESRAGIHGVPVPLLSLPTSEKVRPESSARKASRGASREPHLAIPVPRAQARPGCRSSL